MRKSRCIFFLVYCCIYSFLSDPFSAQTVEDLKKEIQQLREFYNQEIQKLREEVKKSKEVVPPEQEKKLEAMVDKYLKEGTKDTLKWQDIISAHNKVKFYGFIRLDAVYDSHRTDNGNFLFFVNNHNPSPDKQDEELNIHARLTRFGWDLKGLNLPYLGQPEISGKIEIDFYNGGSESRNALRMRHAYLRLNWTSADFELLAGQTADLATPLYNHSIDWNAGQWNLGNTGDRHPQLRLTYSPSLAKINDEPLRLSIAGAILRTGAVDGQDIDADGNNDGEDSGLPTLQWRLGIDIPAFVSKKPIRFGIWGSHAWEETQTPLGTASDDEFRSTVLGYDLTLPLHDRFSIMSEVWWGKNVDDLRGGIAQGVNPVLGKEIEAVGGWISGKIQITDVFSLALGYSCDNPYDSDVVTGGRRFNSMIFVNNIFDLGGGVSCGYEYEYILTYYNRNDHSNYDNRVIAYIMYQF